MKIGILQTGHTPESLQPQVGEYSDMFQILLAGQGFEFETYNVVDMEFPETLDQCDGWLITGSKHGVYEDHPWIAPLEDLIRACVMEARPLVGVCFGHQIIAQALGGHVEKFDGGWAVGRQIYDFMGTEIALNAWHQDQVITAPEGTRVLASNDFCANAALLYGDRAFSVQPHPEFGPDFIEALITTRGRGVVPDGLLDEALEALHLDTANSTMADQIADFFRRERAA